MNSIRGCFVAGGRAAWTGPAPAVRVDPTRQFDRPSRPPIRHSMPCWRIRLSFPAEV